MNLLRLLSKEHERNTLAKKLVLVNIALYSPFLSSIARSTPLSIKYQESLKELDPDKLNRLNRESRVEDVNKTENW